MLQCLVAQTNNAPVTNGVAVMGGYISTNGYLDTELNYFMFLERVQHPWTCFLVGDGGPVEGEPDALGLGWNPYLGSEVLNKISSPPYQYQIGMYLSPGLETAYNAALNGCADFEPLFYANSRMRVDLRQAGEFLGAGPPTWFAVSAGFSTSTHCELPWGPQSEFIDAVRDITDPSPSLAMSFVGNCTAARYANLKYSRTNWNVFDLRQGLRQASTFYKTTGGGWREDGGYGFPLVPNQVGDAFAPSIVPTDFGALDAGPPLQPSAAGKSGPRGPQVSFRWYNFRQSTFDHTRIKIGDITLDAASGESTYNWDVGAAWPWAATNAEFFTVLTGAAGKTSPPEAYTLVPIPPIIAEPQFNSDKEFQFNIYSIPCASLSNRFVHVYQSSDLISWTLAQPLCLPNGKGVFKDSQIAGAKSRFYRLIQGGLHSQTFGFTTLIVAAGKSALIANSFDHCDNSVSNLFTLSSLPQGISIVKQNPADTSAYNSADGSWSNPNLKLSPGEAAWLRNPGTQDCLVRFVGDVREGALLNPIPASKPLLSFMLPISFNYYKNYQRIGFDSDPLGPGATVQRWNGDAFISYFRESWGWIPETPPLQPGEGFSLVPGFSIPDDKPARWEMAFSGLSSAVYVNPLIIAGIQLNGTNALVSFTSTIHQVYSLEYADDQSFSSWKATPDFIEGTGDVISLTHMGGASSNTRFYRIRQQPP